jgi:8-oxo-dGTP pyrophosphatase MutT (NUDIX family)
VYGVCFTKDKEIMIIRNPLRDGVFTRWYLPGGTPELNEKPEKTLIREVDEEADISISKLKLLGAFEMFFPNNPNKEKGDHYYQLRYFAMIDEIREQTIDPSSNQMVERKLIPAEDFSKYVEWGTIGDELIRVALLESEKNS